jgi:two-component system, NarL family, nitrate/nitrite response regulator NarL
MPEADAAGAGRVVVIGEDPLARSGLALLLASDPGLQLVDELAPSGDLAAAVAAAFADVVVWDLGSDPAAIDRVGSLSRGLAVVCLLPDEQHGAELLALGVRGLLLRDVDSAKLCAAASAVVDGLVVLDDALARELLEDRRAAPPGSLENLTPRELEVLELVAEGLSNKLIAARLNISEHTAKFHVNAILTKLGVQSRTEAVVRAARLGVLSL